MGSNAFEADAALLARCHILSVALSDTGERRCRAYGVEMRQSIRQTCF